MTLGKYTILQTLRRDNPAFALYLICVGEREIGRQFSMPCLSDCQWLESQKDAAHPSYTPRPKYNYGRKGKQALTHCSGCGSSIHKRWGAFCQACRTTTPAPA